MSERSQLSYRERNRAIQLVAVKVSVDLTKHKLLSSAHEHGYRDSAQRGNCNRHSQDLKRSQLSYRGRNRAIQLVGVKVSVDLTKHKLLSSAHEREQRDSAHETIAIVTDNCWSAVNCPIEVGIVPLSWLL